MLSLNVVGAGKLGRTLAALWHQNGVFEIAGLFSRSAANTHEAQDFIGAGTAVSDLDELPHAQVWLLAVPDDQIESTAAALAPIIARHQSLVSKPLMLFHCSGALPASVLAASGVDLLASAHPVHSFADPKRSLADLPGSTVALEGREEVINVLEPAFTALRCNCIHLSPSQKVLYHTGSVMACNYLTVLMDLSLQVFQAAGIDNKSAMTLLEPIVVQTVKNNFALGPARALTGPLVRGDVATVARQIEALHQLAESSSTTNNDSDSTSGIQAATLAEMYRALGKAALPLAEKAGLSQDARRQLQSIFDEP
ncbi:Rossmann-like and DUF2520 domain-containing protein [Microbulbifer agarilyticus]|uniref:Rossmann-like and DUF2520 domain-containing protein n=1 Tax=Microbulbifer agarilyticus TaxID=260552 RepID=UPI001CD1F0BC|nr:Rossmann-like and DUF2520 domain-containing protein [Microbulbifer agarilyticus]MCA0900605.1 DUF2520 domain-containing protein [Microbulbifer agarilyticus]